MGGPFYVSRTQGHGHIALPSDAMLGKGATRKWRGGAMVEPIQSCCSAEVIDADQGCMQGVCTNSDIVAI